MNYIRIASYNRERERETLAKSYEQKVRAENSHVEMSGKKRASQMKVLLRKTYRRNQKQRTFLSS